MDHLVEAAVLTPAFLCRVQVRMEERLRRWQAGVPLPWLAVGRPGQVRQDPTDPTIPHFFSVCCVRVSMYYDMVVQTISMH